ncbi:hypothetical protein SUDANB15_00752 [Streptomyces sp. enrichment culture]|uniref:DUF1360 domain-containing protein n=1 Tax=Streptomyces sp. enrichment culture TaxID=1795815 RepID=UPI003F568C42
MTAQGSGHDGGEAPPGGYAALATTFAAGVGLSAVVVRLRGVRLPGTVPPWDLVLPATATLKGSRPPSKDRITSFLRAPFTRRERGAGAGEVMDASRRNGARRAVGDLVTCPSCTSAWVTGGLVGHHACAPRAARLLCAGLTAVTAADRLQYAWSRTEQSAEG